MSLVKRRGNMLIIIESNNNENPKKKPQILEIKFEVFLVTYSFQ